MDTSWWATDHPVVKLPHQRRSAGYRAGVDRDGFKLGLAIEGGGMRGVVSAAMVTAIEELHFAGAIDAVYAASSGAMNAVYFLAGTTWYPLSIYYDDLAGEHFIDFRRALRGRPVMNLDFALDDVLHTLKPLDFDAVLASRTELHIAVTLVDRLQTVAATGFRTGPTWSRRCGPAPGGRSRRRARPVGASGTHPQGPRRRLP